MVNFDKPCAAMVCGVLGCVSGASRDANVTASGDARKNDVYRIDYIEITITTIKFKIIYCIF